MPDTSHQKAILAMVRRLRQEDREEICAARKIKNTIPNIKSALEHSVSISKHVHFFYVKNLPMAVLGIVPVSGKGAAIWMLACDGIESNKGDWVRWSVRNWENYKAQYNQLFNAVYAKNESHLELLRRLNCRFEPINNGFIPFWSS